MKRHALNLFTLFALLVSLIGSFASVTPAQAAGIVVNSNADTVANDGVCTLREAITNANANNQSGSTDCAAGSGEDTITFAANYTITLGSQLPAVTTIMTITGNGAANTIVQASACNPVTTPGGCSPATYRVFEVGSTGDLALNSLTVRHGRCANACATITTSAGGILNDGALTVTNSTVSGNFSNADGGGIYNRNATLTVTNSTLSGNSAYTGGGILNTGTLTVTTNSTLSNNAAYFGGGINNFGILTVTNSTLTDNFVNLKGGGIFNELGTVTVTNSTFSGNGASDSGGGIYNQGTLTLTNSTLSGNSATSLEGGGIYNDGTLTVTNSTLSGNSTGNNGGGIYNVMLGTTLDVYKTAFLNNTASIDGGAINNNDNAVVTISNSTFSGNGASGAGGGVINNGGTTNIYNSTFSGNTSDYGGAFATWNTPTTVISNTIMANSTGTSGDCWNGTGAGTLTGSHNIIESSPVGSASCSTITTSTNDPALGSLTGSPAYFPLNTGSPAINAGSNAICAAAPVSNQSQNGTTRPSGGTCDIGSFEKSSPIPTTATFGDVPTTHPYFADVEILYANGYTAGCSSSPLLFCPETTMNRAQSAVFMVRGNFGISYSPPAAPWTTFGDDFAPGPWAQPWAQGMFDAGLTAGCSSSPRLFCPWEEMPRFQAAVFGMRLKEGIAYPPPAGTGTVFADINGSEWFAGWVEQAYLNGLLPACGSSGGSPLFCPNDLVSRGLAAYMIVRAKNLSMP